jgi:MoxR-like ATPase
LIQCTAGTDENQIRYGWNYALLLAKGPSPEALVKTPLVRAMEEGTLLRLEELTRMGSEVQDTLITVLSEKTLPVPELDIAINAERGFNIIATANNRDKGVNDLSSALKRRFNVVVLPSPGTLEEETQIVVKRVNEIGNNLRLPAIQPADKELARCRVPGDPRRQDVEWQDQAQDLDRHAFNRGGDLRRRVGMGGSCAFWQWPYRCKCACCKHRRRGCQGSGAGRRCAV